jgi:hypothetical protein
MPFQEPKDAVTYTTEITRRAEALIDNKVWTGIKVQRLRAWLSNFRTKEEKYFGACVLDSLVYRPILRQWHDTCGRKVVEPAFPWH